MKPLDMLYISLAVCSFLVVMILGYLAYYTVEMIRSAKVVIDDIASVTEDVKETKDFLKKDVLAKVFELARDFLHDYANKGKSIIGHRT